MVITDFDELYGLEIPDGWTVEKLDPKVGNVKSGKRLPKGYYVVDTHTNHPYIRVIDMRQGYVDTSDLRYVPEEAFTAIQNYRIYKDDIYISVAGTLGIVGQIPEHLDGANLTENANRVTNIKCNIKYLMYWLMGSIIQNTISQTQTLGAQPKLALTRIRNFPVILPPEKEQEKIAGALSDVDALIADLQKLIRKKQDIRQGTMQMLVTGKNRLDGFTGNWITKPLEKLCDLITDGSHESPSEYLDGFYMPSVKDMTDSGFDFSDCKRISKADYERLVANGCKPEIGDVLIAKDGSMLKYVFPVKENRNIVILSSIAILRPKKNMLSSSYLTYYFRQPCFVEQVIQSNQTGTGVPRIVLKNIKKIELCIPEKLNEQEAIADILSDMDIDIWTLEKKLKKLMEIKQGMMEELLTGKVRLV